MSDRGRAEEVGSSEVGYTGRVEGYAVAEGARNVANDSGPYRLQLGMKIRRSFYTLYIPLNARYDFWVNLSLSL